MSRVFYDEYGRPCPKRRSDAVWGILYGLAFVVVFFGLGVAAGWLRV